MMMLVTMNVDVPLLSIVITGFELGEGPESASPPAICTLKGTYTSWASTFLGRTSAMNTTIATVNHAGIDR